MSQDSDRGQGERQASAGPPGDGKRRRKRRPRRRGPGSGDRSTAAAGTPAADMGGGSESADQQRAGARRRVRGRRRRGGGRQQPDVAASSTEAAPPARGDLPPDLPAQPGSPDARHKRSRRRKRRVGPIVESTSPEPRGEADTPSQPVEAEETLDLEPAALASPEHAVFLVPARDDPRQLEDDEPDYGWSDKEKLWNVVGVRFSHGGRVEDFDAGDDIYDRCEHVIVETDKGLQLGVVSTSSRLVMRRTERLPRVIRGVNDSDDRQDRRNRDKEEHAWKLCQELTRKYGLPLKLITVEYLHGGNRAVFYFSAEGRIDFRLLVRDLASRLHTRIEMRQVGVRDASRFIGGVGPCGKCLCCASFLSKFAPVSIRMAKDQNLVLNPQKVSGVCGRLMCCLTYEQKGYEALRKGLPKVGKRVLLTSGESGRIRDVDVLQRLVRVQLEDGSSKVVTADEVQPVPRPPSPVQDPPDKGPDA